MCGKHRLEHADALVNPVREHMQEYAILDFDLELLVLSRSGIHRMWRALSPRLSIVDLRHMAPCIMLNAKHGCVCKSIGPWVREGLQPE